MLDLTAPAAPGSVLLDTAGQPYATLGEALDQASAQTTYRVHLDLTCPRNQRTQLMGRGRTPYVTVNAAGQVIARGWR